MNTLKDFLKLSNGNELNIQYPIEIKDKDGDVVYYENSDGFWYKKEFDSDGNLTYYKRSNGDWFKREYDSKGNLTYFENSDGFWTKRQYDSKGNQTYYENSNGHKECIYKNPIKELTVEQIQNELGYKIKIVE